MDYKITNCNFVSGNHQFPELINTNITEIIMEGETLDERFNLQNLEDLLIGLSGSVRVGPCQGCGRIALYKNKGFPEHETYEDKEICLISIVIDS